MRKTIAAASIAVAGLGVVGFGATAMAGAQGDRSGDDGGGWVQDALGGLVEDGTITQEQADAVEDALQGARPDHGFGGGFGHRDFAFGLGGDPSTVAEGLGIAEDELHSALADGQTIAEIAEEQGVDVQDVVDDIVVAQQERLDEAVADGDLTQEESDEILGGAEERATALVNGEMPDPEDLPDLPELPRFRGHGPSDEGRGPWGGDRPHRNGDSTHDDSTEAPASHGNQGAQLVS